MADNCNSHCNCTKSVQTKLVSISLWGNMADNVTLTATVLKSVQTKLREYKSVEVIWLIM